MMRSVWLLLGFLCCSLVQAEPPQSPDAQQWLVKMIRAAAIQNYQGVIVLGDQKYWDSFLVRHAQLGGIEYEWVEQLTGSPKLSVRHGDEVFCGHAETLSQHHHPLKNPLRPQATLTAANTSYLFEQVDTQRIAGRWTQKIAIIPQDEFRYAVNLWLDLETALLMRSEILDGKKVLIRAQFAQLDFNNILTSDSFIPAVSGHELKLHTTDATAVEQVAWTPQWLPQGFQLKFAEQHGEKIRLLYFDGLVSFSIFMEPVNADSSSLQKRWGATGAVVQSTEQAGQHKQITVVGELPLATLAKIAQSITFNEYLDH